MPIALATAVLRDEAPRLSSAAASWVPPPLETLVARLLERDPAKRPSSGDEVLVELSPLRDAESSPLARRTVLLRRQHAAEHEDRGGRGRWRSRSALVVRVQLERAPARAGGAGGRGAAARPT